MRRFILEFLLTTLVFTQLLFGVIWFRARSRLQSAVAEASRHNRAILDNGDAEPPAAKHTPEEPGYDEITPEMEAEVDACFARLFSARERNDLAAINREIAGLIALGGKAFPVLRRRFGGQLQDDEKLIVAYILAKISEKNDLPTRFLLETVFPYLTEAQGRLKQRRDFERAFETAAAIGTPETLDWIAESFTGSVRDDVKRTALAALTGKGSEDSENVLFGLLESSDDLIDTRRVIGAFLEHPEGGRAARICKLLESEQPVFTRVLLAGLLGTLATDNAGETEIAEQIKEEIPFLSDIVRSRRTTALRLDALQALIRIGGTEAEDIVSEIVEDPNQSTELRILAGKTLAKKGDVDAVTPLVAMLDTQDTRARIGAAEALLALRSKSGSADIDDVLDTKVVPALKSMLVKRETAYTRNVARNLAAIGSDEARNALIELANSAPTDHARVQVVRELGSFSDDEVADILQEIAGKEE
ncbi:MAG: HEAT repeat domain-containing protein, partial [Planctomycetota bacterium]